MTYKHQRSCSKLPQFAWTHGILWYTFGDIFEYSGCCVDGSFTNGDSSYKVHRACYAQCSSLYQRGYNQKKIHYIIGGGEATGTQRSIKVLPKVRFEWSFLLNEMASNHVETKFHVTHVRRHLCC